MLINRKKRNKIFYKKFLRLRVNPLNNNKIQKLKKKKWEIFLNSLKRNNKFYNYLKSHTINNYKASKFASTGNSFKKKYRNDLFIKKTFNYYYGGFLKKYLKKSLTKIYKTKQNSNFLQTCTEYFENRLDSILYKTKFSYSIKNARQLIAHKHIKVNNRIERNKSYILKPGDLIHINSKSYHIIKNNLKNQLNSITKFKLESILYKYKSNSNCHIKNIHYIIDNGYVRVNGKIEKNKHYIIKPTDKINVYFKFHKLINKNILKYKYNPDFSFYSWPLPPSYCMVNYNTLEILFGDNKNYNISTTYPFRLDNHTIVTEHYRH